MSDNYEPSAQSPEKITNPWSTKTEPSAAVDEEVSSLQQLEEAAEVEIQDELAREVANQVAAVPLTATPIGSTDAKGDRGTSDAQPVGALTQSAAEQMKAKRAEERAARRARFEEEKQRILESNLAAEAAGLAATRDVIASDTLRSPKRSPRRGALTDPGSPSNVAIAAVNQRLQEKKLALQEMEQRLERERLLEAAQQKAAEAVQATVRGRAVRLQLQRERRAAVRIQALWRVVVAKRLAKSLAKKRRGEKRRAAAAAKTSAAAAAAAAKQREREGKSKLVSQQSTNRTLTAGKAASSVDDSSAVDSVNIDTRAIAGASGTLQVTVRAARTPKHWVSSFSSLVSSATATEPYVRVTVGEVTKVTHIATVEPTAVDLVAEYEDAASHGHESPLPWPTETSDWEEVTWSDDLSFAAGVGVIDEVGSKGLVGVVDLELWNAYTLRQDTLVGRRRLNWRPLLLAEQGGPTPSSGTALSRYIRGEQDVMKASDTRANSDNVAKDGSAVSAEDGNCIVWEHKACCRLNDDKTGAVAAWIQVELKFTPWPWELLEGVSREEAIKAAAVEAVFMQQGRLGLTFSFPVIEAIVRLCEMCTLI
eukprot:SAG31_NODE_2490_length_5614_cov_2.236990_2_plen_594_part_00